MKALVARVDSVTLCRRRCAKGRGSPSHEQASKENGWWDSFRRRDRGTMRCRWRNRAAFRLPVRKEQACL